MRIFIAFSSGFIGSNFCGRLISHLDTSCICEFKEAVLVSYSFSSLLEFDRAEIGKSTSTEEGAEMVWCDFEKFEYFRHQSDRYNNRPKLVSRGAGHGVVIERRKFRELIAGEVVFAGWGQKAENALAVDDCCLIFSKNLFEKITHRNFARENPDDFWSGVANAWSVYLMTIETGDSQRRVVPRMPWQKVSCRDARAISDFVLNEFLLRSMPSGCAVKNKLVSTCWNPVLESSVALPSSIVHKLNQCDETASNVEMAAGSTLEGHPLYGEVDGLKQGWRRFYSANSEVHAALAPRSSPVEDSLASMPSELNSDIVRRSLWSAVHLAGWGDDRVICEAIVSPGSCKKESGCELTLLGDVLVLLVRHSKLLQLCAIYNDYCEYLKEYSGLDNISYQESVFLLRNLAAVRTYLNDRPHKSEAEVRRRGRLIGGVFNMIFKQNLYSSYSVPDLGVDKISVLLRAASKCAAAQGYDLRFERLAGIDAFAVVTKQRVTLFIDRSLREERQTWLLLHEMAHVLYAHSAPSKFGCDLKSCSSVERREFDDQELEADAFASLCLETLTLIFAEDQIGATADAARSRVGYLKWQNCE